MKDLIIIGTGNHDIVRLIETINDVQMQYNLLGFLEQDSTKFGTSIMGYPVLGPDSLLMKEYNHCAVVNNVMATPKLHLSIYKRLRCDFGINDFPSLIHPSVCTKYVEIGEGNVIYENVVIGTDVRIGNYNLIYSHTSIGHEAQIGESNLLAFNVVIGARTKVGDCNLFANSSTMSLGTTLGDYNSIGVGSVLVSSLGSNQSVLGNPAVDSVSVLKNYIKTKKNKKE